MSTLNASWLHQPTTMLGLGMIAVALLLSVFGLISIEALGCVLAPSLVLMGVNDNTALLADVEQFATDAAKGHLRDNLPRLIQDGVKTAMDAAKRAAALLLIVGLALGLTACANTPAQRAMACAFDKAVQPIAADTLERLVPGATTSTLISTDTLLVHPAIVDWCKNQGGTPAATAP